MACLLYGYQEEALNKMKNGCILNGGVGSGKSRTAIAYYYITNGGKINTKNYIHMVKPCDLYIITTAKKRDDLEWEKELLPFHLSLYPEINEYHNNITVDSWNNIKKYADKTNSFFIFDEQRVVGYGAWTQAFLKIARNNKWILLTATPGDVWKDYIPVFVANGFYKNKTQFEHMHCVFARYTNFPKIDRYINEGLLIRYRNRILVSMDFIRNTVRHTTYVDVNYDSAMYEYISKNRWNIYKNTPIKNASEFCLCLRKLVNSDLDRQIKALDIILNQHPKAIIFYSYDYELDILRNIFKDYPVAEWNGHKHEDIPTTDHWVYLVEYIAGSEGWNCITTDTIIFFSLNYSYRIMEQSSGRIDRVNTPFIDLYYYNLVSKSKIDTAILATLKRKKKFNEKKFSPIFEKQEEEIMKKNVGNLIEVNYE